MPLLLGLVSIRGSAAAFCAGTAGSLHKLLEGASLVAAEVGCVEGCAASGVKILGGCMLQLCQLLMHSLLPLLPS